MKTALTLTNPTPEELAGLRAALNFSSGFAVRRAQMLLQVAAGKTAPTIARAMHCSHPGVRNIIRAFNARGLACLEAQSSAPKSVKPIIQEPQGERPRGAAAHIPARGQPEDQAVDAVAAGRSCR